MRSEYDELLEIYCYGPVDLLSLEKGSDTMWLSVQDAAGRIASVTYHGCVYWRLEEAPAHLHIVWVQKVSIEDLLQRKDSVTWTALTKNSDDVEGLLREWKSEGLNFYMHYSDIPGTEYLVAAKSMTYFPLS